MSYSWWFKSCVYRSVKDIFVFHDTQNFSNNSIWGMKNTLELHMSEKYCTVIKIDTLLQNEQLKLTIVM